MTKDQAIMYLRSMQGICSPQDRMAKEAVRMATDALSDDRPMGEFEICGNSNGLNGTMYYKCSLCGTPIDPCDKFCRGCGAYMKGENHERNR